MENQRRLTAKVNEKVEMDATEINEKGQIDCGEDITDRRTKNLEGGDNRETSKRI